jgi:hypothetical protein
MRGEVMINSRRFGLQRSIALLACLLVAAMAACKGRDAEPAQPTFASPEEAVDALTQAVKGGKLEEVAVLFGSESQKLIDSSDPVTGRRNREVFTVAMREAWRLDSPNATTRVLTIGHEEWPFPIPIVSDGRTWRFDTAAGLEEILARRIGRNELAVIRVCRTYVAAQRLYARTGHDGRRPGLYAAAFRSDPGTQNGLYWPAGPGEQKSPLGDIVAAAAAEGRTPSASGGTVPFHGYYFKILTAQGPAAPGGARSYLQNGEMAGGFALVAWPAEYDVTGVMTFIVNQEGIVLEKDLGPGTETAVAALSAFNPDPSWTPVQ